MRRSLKLSIYTLLFGMALAGQALSGHEADRPQRYAIEKENSCPAQTVGMFLEIFSNDLDIQKKFTYFPIKYRYVDTEALAITTIRFSTFPRFPYKWKSGGIFPNHADRSGQGLNSYEVISKGNRIIVKITNDINLSGVDYYFIKSGTCWKLYLIHDITS